MMTHTCKCANLSTESPSAIVSALSCSVLAEKMMFSTVTPEMQRRYANNLLSLISSRAPLDSGALGLADQMQVV